jgi:hypothetical protein
MKDVILLDRLIAHFHHRCNRPVGKLHLLWNRYPSRRQPTVRTPLAYGMAHEEVEFKSTDGLTIKGWFECPPLLSFGLC